MWVSQSKRKAAQLNLWHRNNTYLYGFISEKPFSNQNAPLPASSTTTSTTSAAITGPHKPFDTLSAAAPKGSTSTQSSKDFAVVSLSVTRLGLLLGQHHIRSHHSSGPMHFRLCMYTYICVCVRGCVSVRVSTSKRFFLMP